MELILKCSECGTPYVIEKRTRRRIIYVCPTCGRTLAVKKRNKQG